MKQAREGMEQSHTVLLTWPEDDNEIEGRASIFRYRVLVDAGQRTAEGLRYYTRYAVGSASKTWISDETARQILKKSFSEGRQ